MIIHIAIFKWKKGAKKGKIENAMRDVEKLKSKVPGIVGVRSGKNFSRHGKGFTHVVVVTAKDGKALEEYRNHAGHVKIARKIESMEEDGIGIDFEIKR